MRFANPEEQYKEFSKEFSHSKDELGIFLKKNFWLIIKTARKRFGGNFDLDEIISDAAAAYDRMKYYHNRRKPTKHTSSYIWFLNKQFNKSSRNGVITDKTRNSITYSENNTTEIQDSNERLLDCLSHDSFFSDDGSQLDREEEMVYGSSLIDFEEIEDAEDSELPSGQNEQLSMENNLRRSKAMPYGPKYLICFESFNGLLSTGLYMVLSALSERKMQRNRKQYEKLLENRRSIGDVSKLLRSNLSHEISQAGYQLYVAVCVNGTRNNVLVAATSEEEAKEHLLPYGEMIELRTMEAVNMRN